MYPAVYTQLCTSNHLCTQLFAQLPAVFSAGVEWVAGDSVVEQGQAAQFRDFVLRVNKYGSVVTAHTGRSLLLVEDVPNVFYRDPAQFHDIIR